MALLYMGGARIGNKLADHLSLRHLMPIVHFQERKQISFCKLSYIDCCIWCWSFSPELAALREIARIEAT